MRQESDQQESFYMIKKAFSTGFLIFLMIVPSFVFAQSDDGFKIAREQWNGSIQFL